MVVTKFDYEELILLRILELNNLMPHYWSELFVLAAQLLNDEEKKILGRMVKQVEKMVLEKEVMFNYYKCNDCKKEYTSKKDWYDMFTCPFCKKTDVEVLQERQSIFDIEMSMESNKDYTAYFLRYGMKITKFDIERRLNRIKIWLFDIVRERSSKRRFRRFR